jgi:hypothetical protein
VGKRVAVTPIRGIRHILETKPTHGLIRRHTGASAKREFTGENPEKSGIWEQIRGFDLKTRN